MSKEVKFMGQVVEKKTEKDGSLKFVLKKKGYESILKEKNINESLIKKVNEVKEEIMESAYDFLKDQVVEHKVPATITVNSGGTEPVTFGVKTKSIEPITERVKREDGKFVPQRVGEKEVFGKLTLHRKSKVPTKIKKDKAIAVEEAVRKAFEG